MTTVAEKVIDRWNRKVCKDCGVAMPWSETKKTCVDCQKAKELKTCIVCEAQFRPIHRQKRKCPDCE